jgi:hypothetical protein
MTATQDLGTFEGRDVLTSSVAVTNAGDGLSQAMSVDRVALHHGDTVYVVLECEVVDVQFPTIRDTDGCNRKHKLRAGTATIVDKATVIAVIDEQRAKIEAARGVEQLPLDDTEDEPATT